MTTSEDLQSGDLMHVERPVYGGAGLARRPAGEVVLLPFVLPGEVVTPAGAVLKPSPNRREPGCLHFGRCGGCQYQMATYPAQVAMKREILAETLAREGVAGPLPAIEAAASPAEWGYRNRIRLRLRPAAEGGGVALGYSTRGEAAFLPVVMCPIAAPWLWETALAFQQVAGSRLGEPGALLDSLLTRDAELELFANGDGSQISLTLLVPRASGKAKPLSVGERALTAVAEAVRARVPSLRGAGVLEIEPRSGRVLRTLASWGATGIAYPVGEQRHWVSRGGFFQVNRLLLERLVTLVAETRAGTLAWDLYAGVGLFARVLAKRFAEMTAVEANPVACADLRRELGRAGSAYRAVESTTLEFLRRAAIERERPSLVVLDPPRAGAGEEACRLLARVGPAEIVYVSCDPATLARDLRVLTGAGYLIEALTLVDLFPQTFHLETVAVLRRKGTGSDSA